MDDPFRRWYSSPLRSEDIVAGGSMVALSLIFLIFYGLVMFLLWKSSKEIIGFRYLLSSAFAECQVMIH
ncbi:hypothetical protein PENTCL1PPCAC_25168 [Pristionchus entomophagus]|uniref:Uncharacterized protein n=1 Tax=Pristionchus entomophagus TaxID=358040 RepID=A0AAV5UA65_9BILA|nr:hypothetical protein PENTCL1PPCAC_25168 [Pristionchus entomophagus]